MLGVSAWTDAGQIRRVIREVAVKAAATREAKFLGVLGIARACIEEVEFSLREVTLTLEHELLLGPLYKRKLFPSREQDRLWL